MPDVTCRVCGEPWDTWGCLSGEGDLSGHEYRQLIAGRGCPACNGHPPCECGHHKREHGPGPFARYLPADGAGAADHGCRGVEHLGYGGRLDCTCAGYRPRGGGHDREHFDSIEGEDLETWEEVTRGS